MLTCNYDGWLILGFLLGLLGGTVMMIMLEDIDKRKAAKRDWDPPV